MNILPCWADRAARMLAGERERSLEVEALAERLEVDMLTDLEHWSDAICNAASTIGTHKATPNPNYPNHPDAKMFVTLVFTGLNDAEAMRLFRKEILHQIHQAAWNRAEEKTP